MESVLVTGAGGFVGENLLHRLIRDYRVYAVFGQNRPREACEDAFPVNLSVRGDFSRALEGLTVDAVVHTAALVSPDLCEREPETARAVNVQATREVAEWAEARGARMVYFSTDLVFDGRKGWYKEEDVPRPLNVYGRTKLEGEDQVRRACTSWVILRLALSYGPTRGARGDWTHAMRRDLEKGKTLRLYTDQFRTPAYVGDTAEIVARLLAARRQGLYHLGGRERVSRYEFGRLFCRIFGLRPERIVPVRMDQAGIMAPRAPDCSLDSGRVIRETGLSMCGVEEGLLRQRTEEEGIARETRSRA